MKKATHFIEVYSDDCGNFFYTAFMDIDRMDNYLNKTKESDLKTVAIFKIYPKTN